MCIFHGIYYENMQWFNIQRDEHSTFYSSPIFPFGNGGVLSVTPSLLMWIPKFNLHPVIQYQVPLQAKHRITMLSVDKCPHLQKQTRGNGFIPCSNNVKPMLTDSEALNSQLCFYNGINSCRNMVSLVLSQWKRKWLAIRAPSQYKDRLIYVWWFPC